MCFLSGSKTVSQPAVQQATSSATEEKKETAKAKSRLLETQGGNKGAELQSQQGQSIRRIFG